MDSSGDVSVSSSESVSVSSSGSEKSSLNAKGINPLKAGPSSIDISVNYEYPTDNSKIVTDFIVTSEGKEVAFDKKVNGNNYVLTIADGSLSNLNITARAAGYIDYCGLLDITKNNKLNINLKATEAYKLGMKITDDANKKLDFASADDILVVSSAGIPKYKGTTSQDALEAILNYQFAFGKGIDYTNLLMLRESAYDQIDFAYIVKKGKQLKIAVYQNCSVKPAYVGTISENMTKKEWNAYVSAVKGENAWSFASLANGWNAGVSREVLQEAAFHGHICEGTLGGFSIVKALLYYYPPIYKESTIAGQPAAAGDLTSYKVLGLPGGSDDDAVLFFLDTTIGKSGYVGIDTTDKGAEEGMLGFIRWNSAIARGDVIVLKFNSNNTKKLFTKETGINPDAGSLEELKYCSWWINKINTNPIDLVEVCYEGTNLTFKDYYYLLGSAANATDENADVIEAVEGHGLDLNYIKSLNLPKPVRSANYTPTVGNMTDADMEQIGIDAVNEALKYFKDELGITVGKDEFDFAVLTDAGYVYIDGQETVKVRDGLYKALGATLYSKTLLQHHQALWKPLHFLFLLSNRTDGSELYSVYIRYDSVTKKFFIGDLYGNKVVDLGRTTLNDSQLVKDIQKTFIPDRQFSNIQTIANAWNANPEYDQLVTFLYHAHVCPGVQPGFFITDYLEENYPLSENDSYTYFGSSIYCKDDSLTYLLGVSPGMGTYYVQKLTNEDTASKELYGGTDEGVIVVWDEKNNIGRAIVVSFKWATIDTSAYATSEAKRAAQIQAYIDLYSGKSNPDVKEPVEVLASHEKWITKEQFDAMKKGVSEDSNVLKYIKSLPFVSKEDLLKAMNANNGTSSNTNTNSNSSSNTNTNTNTNTNSNSNSNSNSDSRSAGGHVSSVSTSVGENNSPLTSESTDDSEDSSADKGNSYEVSQPVNDKSINTTNFALALVGILIILGLIYVGYRRYNKKE